jgi:hypothetical protein
VVVGCGVALGTLVLVGRAPGVGVRVKSPGVADKNGLGVSVSQITTF